MLDVYVFRSGDSLAVKPYRKPTRRDVPLNHNSCHHPAVHKWPLACVRRLAQNSTFRIDFIAARSEFVEILSEALLSADIIDKVRTSNVYDTLRSCSSLARMHQDTRDVPSTVYFTLVLDYHPVLCNARIGKIMSNTVAAFERPLRFLYKAPVRCRVAYRNGSPSLFVRLRACSRISTPDEVLKWSF